MPGRNVTKRGGLPAVAARSQSTIREYLLQDDGHPGLVRFPERLLARSLEQVPGGLDGPEQRLSATSDRHRASQGVGLPGAARRQPNHDRSLLEACERVE